MKRLLWAILLAGLTATATAEIQTRDIEYMDGEEPLLGYLAYDDAIEGVRPGIVIVHQWTGLTDYEKRRARELAELGYVAFAIDVYGKGIRPSAESGEAGKWAGKFRNGDRLNFRHRLQLGLKELKQQPQTDPERLGAIGYCFGGTGAIELARSGADIDAVVSFHGSLDSPSPADGANIKASILACHGAIDPYVPDDEVAAFEREMQEHNVDYLLIKYANAVHSFTQPMAGTDPSRGAAYNEIADKRSWKHMKDFLEDAFQQ